MTQENEHSMLSGVKISSYMTIIGLLCVAFGSAISEPKTHGHDNLFIVDFGAALLAFGLMGFFFLAIGNFVEWVDK